MTRDEILEAAAQIFSQKGFHAASMQDIAQAVNLQKASLYHHITSKQDILLAVLNQALDLLIEHMTTVISQPLAPDEKLREAVRAYLETMLAHKDLASVLLLEHRSLEPGLHELHAQRRDRFEHLWRELLQEGLDSGVFCCIDPTLTTRALLGSMNWTITWFRADGSLNPREISDQYAQLFLQGILVRDNHS